MDDESVPVQVRLEVPVLGALAQLGERLPCTQEVRGSSPLGSTKFLKHHAIVRMGRPNILSGYNGGVAQLVRVHGSYP
jgi:hypothetical protein